MCICLTDILETKGRKVSYTHMVTNFVIRNLHAMDPPLCTHT